MPSLVGAENWLCVVEAGVQTAPPECKSRRIGCASLTVVWLRYANPDNVSTLCDFIERSRSLAQHLSDDRSRDHHYL
jgi:hypothetical protein